MIKMPKLGLTQSDRDIQRDGLWEGNSGPDPLIEQDYYDNIMIRRIFAYIVDLILIGVLVVGFWIFGAVIGLLSFGLLAGPIFALIGLIPIAYHTLFLTMSQSATPGMRMAGIRVYTADGFAPDLFRAFIQTLVFYASITFTSTLILVVALFNNKHRCLHDWVSGCIVLNDLASLRRSA